MVILAVFIIIFGLGVILAFWSMREYGPERNEGRARAVPDKENEEREKEAKERKRKKVSLKGEIIFSPKKKKV